MVVASIRPFEKYNFEFTFFFEMAKEKSNQVPTY